MERKSFQKEGSRQVLWIWLLVALIAAVIEVAASGLFFAGVSAAAVLAAICALFIPGVLPAAIVFAAGSVLYLLALRPTVLRLLPSPPQERLSSRSGPARLAGRRGISTQEITGHSGQIRIGNGEFWSARSYDADEVIPEGTTVEVVLVEGLTALVWPAS